MQIIGKLVKTEREKVKLCPTRAWFVTSWRIVDPLGRDLIQPWEKTKKEAIKTAKSLNIKLIGDLN